MKSRARALFQILVIIAFIFSSVFFQSPQPVQAISPDIVISQVYGGGGNTGATYTHDFIELYNRGSSAVSVTGWSVQYSNGTSWTRTDIFGTIQPGHYFLIRESSGSGGTVSLPTPDATGSIFMSATAGRVALVTNQTNLTCSSNCATAAGVRDFVGYGSTTTNYEGSGPAIGLSNTAAALRLGAGAVDTDDNSADFIAGAPQPRNSSYEIHAVFLPLIIK